MKLYPAKIYKRALAFILDYIIMGIILLMLLGIFSTIFQSYFPHEKYVRDIILWGLLGLYLFHPVIFEAFFNGQTLGKMILSMRVVRTDGSPASMVHCLQRFVVRYIEVGATMGMSSLICALITKRRQRIGDIVADTMVVSTNSHRENLNALMTEYPRLSDEERAGYSEMIKVEVNASRGGAEPLLMARNYRAIECGVARLRTRKSHPLLVDWTERLLSAVHLRMFRKKPYSFGDMLRFSMHSIPQTIYQCRWALLASLAICLISMAVGIYSQCVDPEFARLSMGNDYVNMTLENIANGKPMNVYANEGEWDMFWGIFINNFLVGMRCYGSGLFILVGPLFFLIQNFVDVGCFNTFFFQHGHGALALLTIQQHGTLELATMIIEGGAALYIFSGLFFPGKMTRIKALGRSARASILVYISTIPITFVAAVIESVVTRHTEWPIVLRLSVVIVSFISIIILYVVLPTIANRR